MALEKVNNNDNILSRSGCKNTRSRQAVIDALKNASSPISAEEIYVCIKEGGKSANLSTIYRTLELMESKGLAEKMVVDGRALYGLTGDGHRHHLICTGCRKMVPIDICPLEQLEKDVELKTSFDITGHKLELYGVCPSCRNGKDTK